MSLKIFLLGQFKLEANGYTLNLPARSAQSLLAYLVLNAGVMNRREKLASLLWPEAIESNARGYLRQALWQLRKSLENGSLVWQDYLQVSDISIAFDNQSDYWLDADQLQSKMEARPLEEIIEVARLYRGELLPGFYDEWITVERERLLMAYHQTMNSLLDRLIQAQCWDEVLTWSEQWIRLGYSPEPAYRALMKAYAGLGNLGMIQIAYQRCVEALSRDLNADPSPETIMLNEQLREGQPGAYKTPATVVMESYRQPPFFASEKVPCQIEKPLLVNREPEVNRLDSYLDQAFTGQGRVVFVTGDPGSGKTALVNEFISHARLKYPDLIVASGNCNAHTGIGDPYLPFREILELLTGDVQARWFAGAISKEYAQFLWNLIPITSQALLDMAPDLLDTFISSTALYGRVLNYASHDADWVIRLEKIIQRKTTDPVLQNPHQSDLFIQFGKVLQVLADRAPLVLVLDDLQWADLGSISLLFHLARYLAGKRILIVGAYRQEDIALGRAGERHPLEPVVNELRRMFGDIEINLNQAERRDFIDAFLDSEPNRLGSHFRTMLYQLTRSHPLFTIELLRGMQERGDIVKDEKNLWVESDALDWETLPARVEAVIAERIGRLDPFLQTVLRIASVEGEIFTAEVVARVQAYPDGVILTRLSNELDRKHHLIRAHSVQRIDGQFLSCYRFQHILVQKYLYNSMDEVERVYLHEKVGRFLEKLYSTQAEPALVAPQLARHFLEARNSEKALHYLQQSGERALHMSAYQEAIAHLNQGLALLASLPDQYKYARQELSLQLGVSMAYNLAEGSVCMKMEQASIRALELCQQFGDPTQYCQILSVLSVMNYVKGELQVACVYAEKALKIGQQAENPLFIAMGHWGLAINLFALGDFSAARNYLEQVVSFYNPQKHHREFVLLRGIDAGLSSLSYLACCLWYLGYPDQALQRSREVLDLAHKLGHSFSLADVLRYGCCEIDNLLGDAQSLKTHAEELIRLSQDKNMPAWMSTGKYSLGEALIMLGRIEEGIALVREGVSEELSLHVNCSIPGALLNLTEMYAGIGDLQAGQQTLSEAFEMVERTGERRYEAELYRVQSNLQSIEGRHEEAQAGLLKALEIARRQKSRSLELRAASDLAQLWRKLGKAEEGRQVVKDIYDQFREGFDTRDLKKARALLAK
jgi:predicted ATPase/DNA-binding SARP family transcriptional activator